tara:strand:+ start:54 stop:209 length:156 start_codon:yes stop_codon:yes gene_type:complete
MCISSKSKETLNDILNRVKAEEVCQELGLNINDYIDSDGILHAEDIPSDEI